VASPIIRRTVVKIAFGVMFSLVMFVPAALFLENIQVFGAWIIFWGCCSAIFLLMSLSKELRGFLILTTSLFLSVGGLAYCKKVSPNDLWIVELFSQLMILTGSGIGANYMAAGFLGRENSRSISKI